MGNGKQSTIQLVDGIQTKFCSGCEIRKPTTEFVKNRNYGQEGIAVYCKSCNAEFRYKYKYGISKKEYEELCAKQDYRCTICGQIPKSKDPKANKLQVDHNHQTGKFRGLLCNKCNNGLGCYNDSVELLIKAAEYLISN